MSSTRAANGNGNGNEEWRKNVETHKMNPEEVKKAGLEGSKRHNPGGILHQRRSLPYSLVTLSLAGCAMVGGLWYFTIYAKKKPEATALDVARVSTGMAAPQHTRPRT